jgi:predicted xylose isomerase-like sugar epimerase
MMTITEEKAERALKVIDRCDACGSQAFVLVKLISGELMFCGHHYVKNQDKLNNQAYEIIDEREYINVKPSQPSN